MTLKTCPLGVLLALVMCLGVSTADGAEDDTPNLVNYPHAGLSMALPEGYVRQVAADPAIVMRSGKMIGRHPAQAVTLSAFCVASKTTVAGFADFSQKALESELSVRKFQALKNVPIKVAGLAGAARLWKYTYDGIPTTAARVFFIRKLKDDETHLCYVLTIEVGEKFVKTLLPTLGQIIKTIKLTDVQAPESLPTRLSDRKLSDYRGGFSVKLPEDWYGSAVKGGVSMGQKNYLMNGASSPQIAILSTKTKPDASPEAFATQAVSRYLTASTQPSSGVEVVSKGAVKVGDQDAYQYILKLTYKVSADKGEKTAKPAKVGKIEAVRVVCRRDDSGKSVRAYLLTLSCLESEVKLVTPWLDAIGKGVEYLPLKGIKTEPRPQPEKK
ncbi:MAG: hypothetical protein HN350_07530 [Phycisphaerales bacterium]|nr:hypothetical protein [Phycisphaerales bacterium]